MRKGLLFIFFALMLGSCAAGYQIPQQDFQTIRHLSKEASNFCDATFGYFNSQLAVGVMPSRASFFTAANYCIDGLKNAEVKATEFANKAGEMKSEDLTMSCYRDHFRAAIGIWQDFKWCYGQNDNPSSVSACFNAVAKRFGELKRIAWERCREADDDSSGEPRTGRSSMMRSGRGGRH